jgi:DNA polymerase epsilon subunit 4
MEYLVTEAFTKAKTEKRKTVYYRDLASTVKEVDQFEFLEDVIPATMTLKAAIEKRKETLHDDTPLPSSPPAKKQKTSNNASSSSSTKPKSTEDDETSALEEEEEEPSLDDQDDAVMEDPK